MKEDKLISLTALKNAFAHTLSTVADEDMRQHVMEAFDASVGYVRNCHKPLVFLKGKEEDECVHMNEVVWLEADGSYTKIHGIGGKTQILTANLASTLRQLESHGYDKFLRIHNSHAVNADYVTARCGNTLHVGNEHLNIGKSYKKDFEKHTVTLKK